MLPQHTDTITMAEITKNDIIPSCTKTQKQHLHVTPVPHLLGDDAFVRKMTMIDHEAIGALSPERTSPLHLEAQVGDHPFPILIVSQEDLLLLSGEDEK